MANVAVYNIPGTPTVEILLVDDESLGQIQSLGPVPGVGSYLSLIFSTVGDQELVDYLHTTFDYYRVPNDPRPLFLFPHDLKPSDIVILIQGAIRDR